MPSIRTNDEISSLDFVASETPVLDISAETSIDNATKEILSGNITPSNLSMVLKSWKENSDAIDLYSPIDEETSHLREQYARETHSLSRVLDTVFVGDKNGLPTINNPEKVSSLDELAKSLDDSSKGLLATYISQKILDIQDIYEQTKPRFEGMPRNSINIEAEKSLSESISSVEPLLKSLVSSISSEKESSLAIRGIFENLHAAEQFELSKSLLLDKNLGLTQRTNVAVQYINVFGFISTVELISSSIDQNPALKELYQVLEGDKVTEVMATLWDVYDKYEKQGDFSTYYEDDVTKRDIELISKWSGEVEKRFGKPKEKQNVVSLAAGKGRVALGLKKSRFNVVAIEPQEMFANAIINVSEDTIPVIQKTWSDVSVLDLGFDITASDLLYEGIDQAYIDAFGGLDKAIAFMDKKDPRYLRGVELGESTGRNLPHGNSPQRMLEALDSIRSISKDGAIWVIDVMDPFTGKYKKNISDLRENLMRLGVDPYQANFTFEGPKSNLKFNRMTVSQEQMTAYASMLGFKIREVKEDVIGEGDNSIKNVYYILEVDKDFYPQSLDRDKLLTLIYATGLHEPGIDLNVPVKSWGVSLGNALALGLEYAVENRDKLRKVSYKRTGRRIDLVAKAR